MTIETIPEAWKRLMRITGGQQDCEHLLDDDHHTDKDEWSGEYVCPKCGAKISYDVSDLGD